MGGQDSFVTLTWIFALFLFDIYRYCLQRNAYNGKDTEWNIVESYGEATERNIVTEWIEIYQCSAEKVQISHSVSTLNKLFWFAELCPVITTHICIYINNDSI